MSEDKTLQTKADDNGVNNEGTKPSKNDTPSDVPYSRLQEVANQKNTLKDENATLKAKLEEIAQKDAKAREEQLKKNEGGFFSRFKNKKITDADVTAALNPKRLTTEEKIERLMTGKDSGGVVKLSREEALEALKKPKQLTNKEKLQNLIDSDSPQHSNIKTEADAKNYLNPKPLTEQQQYEYIAGLDRFSLSGPEEAAKAFNNTPLTEEEKIKFIQDSERNRSLQLEPRISAEEAENILNPKNKHFEQPTSADDTPADILEIKTTGSAHSRFQVASMFLRLIFKGLQEQS